MDRLTQSVLVTLVGGALVGLTASGRFALYVKTGFGPLLLAAGITLMIVGAMSVVVALRSGRRRQSAIPVTAAAPAGSGHAGPGDAGPGDGAPDHAGPGDGAPDHAGPGDAGPGDAGLDDASLDGPGSHTGHAEAGHDHDRSRAAWLLVLPVLALLLAPPALGADAVARTSGSQAMADTPPPVQQIVTGDGGYAPNDGLGKAATETVVNGQEVRTMTFPPLPAGKDPALPLKEFVQRALYDATGSVTAHRVTITGFIAPPGENFTGGYSIAQLIISCCAADARAIRVHVDGTPPFGENTWVTAVVTAYPGSGTAANEYVPSVSVASIGKRPQPADPYGR